MDERSAAVLILKYADYAVYTCLADISGILLADSRHRISAYRWIPSLDHHASRPSLAILCGVVVRSCELSHGTATTWTPSFSRRPSVPQITKPIRFNCSRVGGLDDTVCDGYLEYSNEGRNAMRTFNRRHFLEALRRRPPAFRAAGPIFADLISLRFRA